MQNVKFLHNKTPLAGKHIVTISKPESNVYAIIPYRSCLTHKEVDMPSGYTPEFCSILGMYGNKTLFQEKLDQGYKEVSFGKGPWVKDDRLVGIFMFYHSKKEQIATLETHKFYNGSMTVRGHSTGLYKPKELEELIGRYKLQIWERQNLKEILDLWE